jgi:hypothetical protein
MITVKKTIVRRTKRTDPIIFLRLKYEGNAHADPRTYNRAYAEVLHLMADAIGKVKDAWACPEFGIWMHRPGEITAEVMLSPME